jgi:hypothetical protein
MWFVGSRSWRFAHDDLDFLVRALIVRDAAELPVAGSPEVPPPVTRDLPAGPAVLPEADRPIAALQWLQWWRQMLDQAVREIAIRRAEDEGEDQLLRIQARVSGRQEVYDPPDFGSLSATPELRSAAVAVHARWLEQAVASAGRSRPAERAPEQLFEWHLVRDAAQQAATALGLDINEMDAVAHVMPVEGLWSYLAGPRCGVCSVGTAADPDAASELLRKLFMSGEGAGPGAEPKAR